MDILIQLFPGISSLFIQDPIIAVGRIALIFLGGVLAYLGFKRTLEPLIMVPMGLGMLAVNAGVLFLDTGVTGTLMLNPMVSETNELMNIMQINFLQPIYNMMFSNGLIACLVFLGIGVMSEIGFILARPWISMMVAVFAELGTFVTIIIGYKLGLAPGEAAAVATIGGADGPMVLFSSLIMAKDLFVPIAIIAYLYLSLTYVGYPYLIKLLVKRKYRGIDVEVVLPDVPAKNKIIFTIIVCTLLCLLLPVATPLILSFFLGVIIKEAKIEPFQKVLETTVTYMSTLFLGLLLGVLCEAQTILQPKVGILVVLGIVALTISGIGGLLGGWLAYFISKKKYNPVIGIAGVSCIPTTPKIAQKIVAEENPYAMILPLAMGASVSGLIVSAIATGVFVSTISMVGG